QLAIGSEHGVGYRPAIVGARAGQSDGVSDGVERGRRHLGGLEVHSGPRIVERGAAGRLGGIVVIEAERCLAALLAAYMARAASFMRGAGALAACVDAGGCSLLTSEVTDRSAGVIIGVRDVDAMRRVQHDLEEIRQSARRAAV